MHQLLSSPGERAVYGAYKFLVRLGSFVSWFARKLKFLGHDKSSAASDFRLSASIGIMYVFFTAVTFLGPTLASQRVSICRTMPEE